MGMNQTNYEELIRQKSHALIVAIHSAYHSSLGSVSVTQINKISIIRRFRNCFPIFKYIFDNLLIKRNRERGLGVTDGHLVVPGLVHDSIHVHLLGYSQLK